MTRRTLWSKRFQIVKSVLPCYVLAPWKVNAKFKIRFHADSTIIRSFKHYSLIAKMRLSHSSLLKFCLSVSIAANMAAVIKLTTSMLICRNLRTRLKCEIWGIWECENPETSAHRLSLYTVEWFVIEENSGGEGKTSMVTCWVYRR